MKKYNSFLGAFFSGDNGQGGYNAAYRQGALAKLYTGSLPPEQQQEAVAGLARVDPDAAYKFQQTQQAAQQESLKRKTMLIANAPPAQRGQLYASVLPEIRKDWADAPDVYDANIDAMVTNWAKTVSGASSSGKFTGAPIIIQTPKGPRYARYSETDIVPTDFTPGGNFSLFEDPATGKKWRFNSKTGQYEPADGVAGEPPQVEQNPPPAVPPPQTGKGGIVFPEDVAGAAQRTGDVMQQVRTEIAQLVAQGVPVADATSQVTQKYARQRGLTMPPQGQQPAPVVQQPVAPLVAQRPVPQSGGYQGMSAAEKARAEAEAKAAVEYQYAAQIEAAKAMAKAQVEGQTAPQIAGATTAAQEEARNRVAVSAKADARVRDANDILSVLDEVEKILPEATGSPGGYAVDSLLGTVGYATKGAEANAKLEIYSSELVRRVPRFEGPQSDADRQAYMVAAGDVANPAKPIKVRMAAVQTMRALQQKYATGGVQPPAGAPVKISTKQQYDALPSGTEYIGPDGKKARKK